MNSLTTLLAAGAFSLSAAVLSPAVLAADEHRHGHGAAPAKLQLDHGKKWKTDEPLRKGMASIRETVHGAPAPLHKGTAKPEAYAEVGSRVEADVGRIVKECKLPPEADAQLHIVVAELVAGADALKTAKDGKSGRAGLLKIDGALKSYGKYFDHPGWK
jgi:hypothetical protein